MNCLAQALARVCREHLLAEKWLIAPSLRIGRQWLDAVTRSGQPIVNVRVKTLLSLAIELAAPAMGASQKTFLSARGGEMLVERVLQIRRKLGLSYLGHLEPSAGLSRAVHQALLALRHARLSPDDLTVASFEVADKGRDLRLILRDYQAALEAERWIDDAGVLELAARRLAGDPAAVPHGGLLLVPEGTATYELERRLLAAFPPGQTLALEIDEPSREEEAGTAAESDLAALRGLLAPDRAPTAPSDGSVRIRSAIGEVNEVRGALRDLIGRGIPWDDVEILHSDVHAYVPLVYEVLSALSTGPEDLDGAEPPATFAEGIPIRYSRPGRALALWVAWIREDFPQDTLLKMLREGLLEIPTAADGPSPSRLARLLRRVGIGFGRARYLPMFAERKKQLEFKLAHPEMSDNEDEEVDIDREAGLKRRLVELETLERLCRRLLGLSPALQAEPHEVLASAQQFLRSMARGLTQLDNSARWRLIDEIEDMTLWIRPAEGTSLDVWNWLATLPAETRVLGSGPRPGAIHVAPLLAGGHTGRKHTYILGLDDSRFPGGGLEDPLLLDFERKQLSDELTTGAAALEERSLELVRLLARLRGSVTLSFSARSVTADREMFPSPAVLAAFRILSGQPDGDPSALARWLAAQGPPISFAPLTAGESLGAAEWWTHRLCGEERVECDFADGNAQSLVEGRYPHLLQGRIAVASRGSGNQLTPYDGIVPAAGVDLDPTAEPMPGGKPRVMSAHGLTTIGRCPLAFFFRYGLKIEQPHPAGFDPEVWLDHSTLGLLLHELFETFVRELVDAGRTPDFARDRSRLRELLEAQIEKYRRLVPPPRTSALVKQCELLRETAETFLGEEEAYCREQSARPVYLEASLGMPKSPDHSTPLDTTEPLILALPAGKRIWLRGRVDRIDEILSPGEAPGGVRTFAIWDYKTGGTWGYNPADPFREGRMLQPYLYVTMVEHRLLESIGPAARVGLFGFFFPARKGAGERIAWTPGELKDGGRIVELLTRIVASGAFLPTTNSDQDCKFCDFLEVCGNVKYVSAGSRLKLAFSQNPLVEPLRELRAP